MFPPTHRIYRSIRPRNRFIIGNKRRGLQAVSAICISLILIIYGLENIYTMYDQYDFESQNFGRENRRLTDGDDYGVVHVPAPVSVSAVPLSRVALWDTYADATGEIERTAIRKWTTPKADTVEGMRSSRNPSGSRYFETNNPSQWWMLLSQIGTPQFQKVLESNVESAILTFGNLADLPMYKLFEDQTGTIKSNAINTWTTQTADNPEGPMYFETDTVTPRHTFWKTVPPNRNIATYQKIDASDLPHKDLKQVSILVVDNSHTPPAPADTETGAQGQVNLHSDPQNAEFVARAPGDTDIRYFFLIPENQWTKLNPDTLVPTYESVDAPPKRSHISYRPSATSQQKFASKDKTPRKDQDIEKHAIFKAFKRYFYSLVDDQWGWWVSEKQGEYFPKQPLQSSTITYVHRR